MYNIYFANLVAGPAHSDNCPSDAKKINCMVLGVREETLVYSDLTISEDNWIHNPKLNLRENEAGELTFEIYPEEAETIYSNEWLSFMNTEIMVTKDDGTQPEYIIWCGRLVSRDRTMHNSFKCTCEGDMNYLYDMVLRPERWHWMVDTKYIDDPTTSGTYNKDYWFPVHVIRQYNYLTHYIGEVKNRDKSGELDTPHMDHICKYFYMIKYDETLDPGWTMGGGKTFSECNTPYERLHDFIEDTGAFMYITYDDFGGRCSANGTQYSRRKYINITASRPGDINNVRQTISFGYNLLDYADTIDMSGIHNFSYAVGEQVSEEDGSQLPIYAIASPYNPNHSNYIYKQISGLDYAIMRPYTYDTDDEEYLYEKTKENIESQDLDKTSITLSCIDINYSDGVTSLDFLYPVRVISPVNDIDGVFYITSMDIDMENPDNNQITLDGYKITAVTNLIAMTDDTKAIKRSVKYINGQVGNVGKVLDTIVDV